MGENASRTGHLDHLLLCCHTTRTVYSTRLSVLTILHSDIHHPIHIIRHSTACPTISTKNRSSLLPLPLITKLLRIAPPLGELFFNDSDPRHQLPSFTLQRPSLPDALPSIEHLHSPYTQSPSRRHSPSLRPRSSGNNDLLRYAMSHDDKTRVASPTPISGHTLPPLRSVSSGATRRLDTSSPSSPLEVHDRKRRHDDGLASPQSSQASYEIVSPRSDAPYRPTKRQNQYLDINEDGKLEIKSAKESTEFVIPPQLPITVFPVEFQNWQTSSQPPPPMTATTSGGIALDPVLSSLRSSAAAQGSGSSSVQQPIPEISFDETINSSAEIFLDAEAHAAKDLLSPHDADDGSDKGKDAPFSRSPELRISHKLAERKRRKEMKDLFDELREQLPQDRGMKASKWEILSKGLDMVEGGLTFQPSTISRI
jgi:hypothetical protein